MKKRLVFSGGILAVLILLAACASGAGGTGGTSSEAVGADPAGSAVEQPMDEDTLEPASDAIEPDVDQVEEDPFGGIQLGFDPDFWPDTDFSRRTIDYSEIMSGGPPPDGIPSIDEPVFDTVEEADEWLQDDWPVMFLRIDESVRVYPMAILVYHEIVNDIVSGEPVTVTYCPLCNSAIVYERKLEDGMVLDFGTTGNLRNSDLVMYDRQTRSWWQQFTGDAIVGELTGTLLQPVPSQIIRWGEIKRPYPQARVLSRETGHSRPYGSNPYSGYDTSGNPFLYRGEIDQRLPATERVVTVELGGETRAYSFEALREQKVINDEVGGLPVVIFWQEGTKSLFSPGFDTGSSAVFFRQIDGEELRFQLAGSDLSDEQTGTVWNIFGEGERGELQGERLRQVPSMEAFWFAWAAFQPDTTVWPAE